jgi:hypothetical protein
MATNLSIDPELIECALEVSGERTKKAAVTKALQEFIARRRQKCLLVWRFRIPHHSFRESDMRTSEPKPH